MRRSGRCDGVIAAPRARDPEFKKRNTSGQVERDGHRYCLRSRYEITCTSISISLRLLMPFRNVFAQLILLQRLTRSGRSTRGQSPRMHGTLSIRPGGVKRHSSRLVLAHPQIPAVAAFDPSDETAMTLTRCTPSPNLEKKVGWPRSTRRSPARVGRPGSRSGRPRSYRQRCSVREVHGRLRDVAHRSAGRFHERLDVLEGLPVWARMSPFPTSSRAR